MTPDELAARLRRWVEHEPVLPGALDPATMAFCRRKLRQLAEPGLLRRKLEREVTGPWEPLGRVLLVISEHDVLGTVAGAVAACATGNRLRVKARTTRPLVEELARVLELGPDECEILDWDSRDQDDRAMLEGVDGVLLTGGDALIRRYRTIAPPGVRLIEFGPKIGVAAIGGEVEDYATLAGSLASDVTLFGQGVCSSPQVIFVEDEGTARVLRRRLLDMKLPPLTGAARLLQLVRLQELALLARLGDEIIVDVAPHSGWGVTISRDPAHRLPKGFAFVVGPLHVQLTAFAQANRRYLQTLGTWGPVPELDGFTHRCRIGRMHDRPPLAPHDGVLELASLVRLVSRGDGE
ncbi:MAG TPA: acyl-CoA reductase [Kofleriaceae bacterium]|nr:acyl-CoA reductase [Kofleriaceae bacterium]